MGRNLGASDAASTAVPARRVHRPGWRDLRMWVGVAIVAGCVVLGSRLMAAADDTVGVWSVTGDMAPGAPVGARDLTATKVRLDPATMGEYFAVSDPLPAASVLSRSLTGGELLPRSALVSADGKDLVHLPIAVDPVRVPPGVGPGSVIDVYAVGATATEALSSVSVLSMSRDSSGFGADGQVQLVVIVAGDQVQPFLDLLAGDTAPQLSVIGRT